MILVMPPKKSESTVIRLEAEGPVNPSAPYAASAYAFADEDNSFDMADFRKNVKLEISSIAPSELCFSLTGVDAPIANAFRRIMIGEVETVAIDKVHLWQNTGVMHDEVLVHRIGLVPIQLGACSVQDVDAAKEEVGSVEWDQTRAIKFRLHKKCPADFPKGDSLEVTSGDLIFVPQNSQQKDWIGDQIPHSVSDSILLTKLRPGQEIEAEFFCLRGSAKIHAKWSPVCSATYRLQPLVSFTEPIRGEEAKRLVGLCPKKVFDIEDMEVRVKNVDNCSACRLCIEEFPGRVQLGKQRDRFLFTIESTGSLPAADIFAESIAILREKAQKARANLKQ